MKRRVIPQTKRGQISLISTLIALLFACSAEIRAFYSEEQEYPKTEAISSEIAIEKQTVLNSDNMVELKCNSNRPSLIFIPDNHSGLLDLSTAHTFKHVIIDIKEDVSGTKLTLTANIETDPVSDSESSSYSFQTLATGYLKPAC